MQFGIFYEHQLPRPWVEGAELKLFQDALGQVELADKLGIEYAWEVEHHFLEEYAYSSAPEVFLVACSQRTKRIRLGHGIVLMPPPYNHPARVAERIATLDLVSAGRVEWGTGESASLAELGGFGISVQDKQPMWQEATREAANMMVMDPYPGYQGYYDIIKSEACVPIGHSVNANIAMVGGFSCHADAEEARRRGLDGFRFFGYALGHHYIFGEHLPGRTNIWANYEQARDLLPIARGGAGAIGSPEEIESHLRRFEDAGVDQMIFVQQGGRNRHEDICESMALFAKSVLPGFKRRHAERATRKQAELAPFIEAALRRKPRMAPLGEADIPTIVALGRQQAKQESVDGKTANFGRGSEMSVPLEDPLKQASAGS